MYGTARQNKGSNAVEIDLALAGLEEEEQEQRIDSFSSSRQQNMYTRR
jgi:hypothetical protein